MVNVGTGVNDWNLFHGIYIATKSEDLSRNNGIFIDSDFTKTLPVGTYLIEMLVYLSAGIVGNFKYYFGGSANFSGTRQNEEGLIIQQNIPKSLTTTTIDITTSGESFNSIKGIIKVTKEGEVDVYWGLSNSDSTPTILKKGSSIIYRKVI